MNRLNRTKDHFDRVKDFEKLREDKQKSYTTKAYRIKNDNNEKIVYPVLDYSRIENSV